ISAAGVSSGCEKDSRQSSVSIPLLKCMFREWRIATERNFDRLTLQPPALQSRRTHTQIRIEKQGIGHLRSISHLLRSDLWTSFLSNQKNCRASRSFPSATMQKK